MIFKIIREAKDPFGHSKPTIKTDYFRAESVDRVEDMGQGQVYIYFQQHGILCNKEDKGIAEVLAWFHDQSEANHA